MIDMDVQDLMFRSYSRTHAEVTPEKSAECL